MKIAFYSYKGGVGRTKVMIGVGALLVLQGYRVGMLDFDLDASGLVTIFGEDLETLGTNELLHILRNPILNLARVNDAMLDRTNFVVNRLGSPQIRRGRLKYLPTVSTPTLSADINLNSLGVPVQDLLDRVHKDGNFDYLFIDVKPGFSPSANIILPNVDRAVVIARIDSQNIEGLKRVIPRLANRNLAPVIVANMVPNAGRAIEYLNLLENACGQPISVCIAYDSDLLFDDDISNLAKPGSLMRIGLEELARILLRLPGQ